MKKLLFSVLVILIGGYSCNQAESAEGSPPGQRLRKMINEKDKIYVTALIYIRDGEQDKFETYRSKAAAILERYNARIEKVIKPTMMAKGELPLPDEIHFAVFDSKESMDAVNNDPEYQTVIEKYRTPSIENLIVIPSRLSDFQFEREIGDRSKVYGIAFLNYGNTEGSAKLFEDYHDKVCAIMPEFGTHFERFLIPTGVKGDFRQPDEIHRFYFDSMAGLEQMGSDQRMQALFPQRDKSLSELNFIIGEAI